MPRVPSRGVAYLNNSDGDISAKSRRQSSAGRMRPYRWLRNPLLLSELRFLGITFALSLATYYGTTWILMSSLEDSDVGFEQHEYQGQSGDDTNGHPSSAAASDPLSWIGKKVEVHWPKNSAWYLATVTHYDNNRDMHLIQYDVDGLVERLSLNDRESVRLHYGHEWVGREVEILYQNNRWYSAIITAMTKTGSHVVQYHEDGTKETIFLHKVRIRVPTIPEKQLQTESSTPMALTRLRQHPGEDMTGESIEILNDDDNAWYRVKILSFNAETGEHTVINLADKNAQEHTVILTDSTYRIFYGDALVGAHIKIFWAEYNNWYDAIVESYDPKSNLHGLRYTDDNSTETLLLGQQRVSVVYGSEIVGSVVRIFDKTDWIWWGPCKVLYYDAERDHHVLVNQVSGDVRKLVLSELTIRFSKDITSDSGQKS